MSLYLRTLVSEPWYRLELEHMLLADNLNGLKPAGRLAYAAFGPITHHAASPIPQGVSLAFLDAGPRASVSRSEIATF